MPDQTDMSRVVELPAGYQEHGGRVPESAEVAAASDAEQIAALELAELEEMPVATIDNWLNDQTPITEWVVLRTRKLKVLVKGLTEQERGDIERTAPKVMNKATRRPEIDQNWINLEIVRRSLVDPAIPDKEMLKRALAGELAYLAQKIGEVSGFEIGDALG